MAVTSDASTRPPGRERAFDRDLSLFNLRSPSVIADPHTFYHHLRSEDPVHWDGYLRTWVVTRHRDALAVLTHDQVSGRMNHAGRVDQVPEMLRPVFEMLDRQLLYLDPPDHTRLRRLMGTAFVPRLVEALRGRIATITSQLIDRVVATGSMDVVSDLAYPLPMTVATELLGLQVADLAELCRWADAFGEIVGTFGHVPDRIEEVVDSVSDLVLYLADNVRRLRRHPGDDLTSMLIGAMDEHAQLSEAELVANLVLLLAAGRETTTNLLANAVLALLHHPDAAASLRRDPSLMRSAVEEFLRFDSPTQYTGRVAIDAITIGGREIQAGESIAVVFAAANRDPERFPEPDRLILDRSDNRHIAFGHGIHFCFGAHLARIQAQIALGELLSRCGDLRIERPPAWRPNSNLRGLESLRVGFAPR